MSDSLVLLVGGQRYTGWKEAEITRPFDALSGSFSVRATPTRAQPWPIPPGAEVVVLLAGERILTGYVDRLQGSISRQGGSMQVSGRDRTGDLVDSSAINEPGQWKGLALDELARALADPFDVEVRKDGDVGPVFDYFKLEPGETAGAALERAARLRGVIARTDGHGVLLLSELGARPRADVDLVEGENVMAITIAYSYVERFATYSVRGQGPGSDEAYGATVAAVQGQATDEEVPRYRPLLIIPEGPVSPEAAQRRAEWEAIVRAARSASITVAVQGWRQSEEGRAWREGEIVRLTYPSLAIDVDLLVAQVLFRRSRENGTTAELALVRKDAYLRQPTVPKGEAWNPLWGLQQGVDATGAAPVNNQPVDEEPDEE